MALAEYEYVVVFLEHTAQPQAARTAGEAEAEVTFQMCIKQPDLHHRRYETWIIAAVFSKLAHSAAISHLKQFGAHRSPPQTSNKHPNWRKELGKGNGFPLKGLSWEQAAELLSVTLKFDFWTSDGGIILSDNDMKFGVENLNENWTQRLLDKTHKWAKHKLYGSEQEH